MLETIAVWGAIAAGTVQDGAMPERLLPSMGQTALQGDFDGSYHLWLMPEITPWSGEAHDLTISDPEAWDALLGEYEERRTDLGRTREEQQFSEWRKRDRLHDAGPPMSLEEEVRGRWPSGLTLRAINPEAAASSQARTRPAR